MDTVKYLRDSREPGVRTMDDMQAALATGTSKADTLSLLSRVIEPDRVLLEREKVLPAGAAGANGAAYKMLRTQVLRRLGKLGVNSVAIVGTAPGTGKSLTALNLAIAIAAEPERSALLIDLDLRKPSVHRRLGFTPTVGIDDCRSE